MDDISNKRRKLNNDDNDNDNVNDSQGVSWANLPNQVISCIVHQIFEEPNSQKDLYECALVSKNFYHHANRLLWHSLVISNEDSLNRFLSFLANTQVVPEIPTSTNISGGDNEQLCYSIPHSILQIRQHVRHFYLQGDETKLINSVSLIPLFSYCPNLTKISMPDTRITQLCIDTIAQHCHDLTELELCASNLPQDTFKSLAVTCPDLTTLGIHSNDMMTLLPRNPVLNDAMIVDLAKFDKLTHLTLDGVILLRLPVLFFNIMNAWPMLTHLHLNYGENVGDQSWIPFIETHPLIESLYLEWTRFSDATVTSIIDNLRHLKHFTLIHNSLIRNSGVARILTHCRCLKSARFQYCTRVRRTYMNTDSGSDDDSDDSDNENGMDVSEERIKEIQQQFDDLIQYYHV